MIYMEQTWCSFRAGWETPPLWRLFEERRSFSSLGLSLRGLPLRNLLSGLLSWEIDPIQISFLSKLVEEYAVVKIKFW